MLSYMVQRVLQIVPVLFLVATIVFSMMHLIPGDPAMLMLSGQGAVTRDAIMKLREKLGLNRPLYVQYADFIWDAIRGNLGDSTRLKSSVTDVIMQNIPFTASLAGGGLIFSLLIGLPLGVLGAIYRGTWIDSISMSFALFGVSVPLFWLGLMLILFFAFRWPIFPPTGSSMDIKSLVLPAFTLGFAQAGLLARLTRSALLEIVNKDYIRTARSKGLWELIVIGKHAMRNALIPVITIVGLQLGRMFTGAAVTETVFSRPGLGRLIVNAVKWKDFPLVQGAVLTASIIFLTMNLIVDLLYAYLDPRIRYD